MIIANYDKIYLIFWLSLSAFISPINIRTSFQSRKLIIHPHNWLFDTS